MGPLQRLRRHVVASFGSLRPPFTHFIQLGSARVPLPSVACRLPNTVVPDDYTLDNIRLFQIAETMAPNDSPTAVELEHALRQAAPMTCPSAAFILSQSSSCLTVYRRLRITNASISPEILSAVIETGGKGVNAALSAATASLPWWHVVNVSFPCTCVLAAMDHT